MTSPVAVITAAAHRGGKRIGDFLVDDGWDLAFWATAGLHTRAATAASKGQRAAVARGNLADPRSVAFMVAATREVFPVVDAVVHVSADHLAFGDDGSDPATDALVAMGAAVVVYLAEPGWDASSTIAWCGARQVEAVVVDATLKVHTLAPLVRESLAATGAG